MVIAMRPFTHTRTCERGSSLFSAMTQISWESTTRASLPRILSTEITNGKKCFCWLLQCLSCLYFLIFSYLARIDAVGLYLYVSASVSLSLTSMMVSTWRSHKPRIITSPLVSLCLSLPWHISCSDLVRPWCIRGLARTDSEQVRPCLSDTKK